MRNLLIATVAALGIFSFSGSANAFCGPANPWIDHLECGPYAGQGRFDRHATGYVPYRHHHPMYGGYAINGLNSPMPYRIRDPYAGGYAMSGYRSQSYSMHRVSTHSYSYHTQTCHDYVIHNGVKTYTNHYAC